MVDLTASLERIGTPAPAPARGGARPHLLGEVLIVACLLKVYDYIRSLEAAREPAALRHGLAVLDLERLLRLNWELAANLWVAGHHVLESTAIWWYQLTHIGVTLSVLILCYVRDPRHYRSARNALVATNVVGLLVFLVLPVMPPRLLPGAGYVDSVADAGFGTSHAGSLPADQYAAMPSLHLAWATWVAIVVITMLVGKRWRWAAVLYPATTAAAVVVTANHFVLDVVAGVLVAVVAALATGLVPGRERFVEQSQMMRRRSSTANTTAEGTSGAQTVSRR